VRACRTRRSHFLSLLRHMLGQRYVLRALALGPKRSRVHIDSLEAVAAWDTFLDVWQSTLGEFPIMGVQARDQMSLVLEIPSVFDHDARA
jgi:hypothetical protein